MFNLGVLVSGNGSNLQAILDDAQDIMNIAVVISNQPHAYALERAQKAGIKTVVASHKGYANRAAYDAHLTQILEQHGVQLVCLAGFMRLLSPEFVQHWYNRLVNIHPSLLPAYKGLHVHERVLADGVRFTGCTVHYVREEMDVGPIIGQAVVAVRAGDTPETLALRVHQAEHRIYPQALRRIALGHAPVVQECVPIAADNQPIVIC